MRTSEQINELAAALAKAQGDIEPASKDANNPFFRSKYADLATVREVCREPLAKNGLSLLQVPSVKFLGEPTFRTWTTKNGDERQDVNVITEVSVTTRLQHSSGQWIESDPVPCVLPKGDPQSIGSAITYLRRYTLGPLLGIVAEEDDDGNAASGPPAERQHAPRPPAKDRPNGAPAEPPKLDPAHQSFIDRGMAAVKDGILTKEDCSAIVSRHKKDYAAARAELDFEIFVRPLITEGRYMRDSADMLVTQHKGDFVAAQKELDELMKA